jgi:uncharacterized Zn finger protein
MAAKLIHKSWWGGAFVLALETYIDPGRLLRGKAYRTDSRVLDFDISANEIKATIRGNVNHYFDVTEEPRYKVVLKFDQIKPLQWQRIIKNISGNALWLSKLMLNEIPANIEDAFESGRLLPTSYDDVEASCSCPDYSNPCKHIAGVYYRIANILDSRPMLLFQLRGLPPEELHTELKKTELGQAFSEHLSLPESVEMEYQQHMYTPTHVKRETNALNQKPPQPIVYPTAKLSQFWSMPLNIKNTDDEGVNLEGAGDLEDVEGEQRTAAAPENIWPLAHPDNDSIIEISAALIKKQGDYPEFWTNNHSFIGAMELFYSHTRKKNNKDLL